MKLEHPKAPKWRPAGEGLERVWNMSFPGRYPESVCSRVSLTDARGLLGRAARFTPGCSPEDRNLACIPLAQLLG